MNPRLGPVGGGSNMCTLALLTLAANCALSAGVSASGSQWRVSQRCPQVEQGSTCEAAVAASVPDVVTVTPRHAALEPHSPGDLEIRAAESHQLHRLHQFHPLAQLWRQRRCWRSARVRGPQSSFLSKTDGSRPPPLFPLTLRTLDPWLEVPQAAGPSQ